MQVQRSSCLSVRWLGVYFAGILLSSSFGSKPVDASCPYPAPFPHKWCGTTPGSIAIPVYYGVGLGFLQNLSMQTAIQAALDDWRTVSQTNLDVTFQFNFVGHTGLTSEEFDKLGNYGILFTYQQFAGDAPCTGNTPLSEGAYGQAVPLEVTERPGTDELRQAWVSFNSSVPWNDYSGLRDAVAKHEIGHALGVGHANSLCPPPQLMHPVLACSSTALTFVDEAAIAGAGCQYGRWSGPCESSFGLEWLILGEFVDPTLELAWCTCSSICESVPAARSPTGAVLTYELAISDEGGPYTPFDTLQASDWVNERFTPQFAESHTNAFIRLRVFEDDVLVDEAFTARARDIEANVTGADGAPVEPARLLPPVPNPFAESTRIRYHLARRGPVSLHIYDAGGRLVRTLDGGADQPPGVHERTWNGRDDRGRLLRPGVYFYRVRVEGFSSGGVLVWLAR